MAVVDLTSLNCYWGGGAFAASCEVWVTPVVFFNGVVPQQIIRIIIFKMWTKVASGAPQRLVALKPKLH